MRDLPAVPALRQLCVPVLAALALALGLGCGSGTPPSRGGYGSALPSGDQQRGGTLKVLATERFGHLDPGAAWFQLDYMITSATHRALYAFRPDDPRTPVPDLAEGPPVVSSDGRTVRVKLKRGIRYGTNERTPVSGMEVTAADVKYAIERGLNPSVDNGYVRLYFPLVGSEKAGGGEIPGITTPDRHTIVFKLSRPFGATTARALVLPITAPVPRSYAAQFDAKDPNRYDSQPQRQAFTGPYMIRSYEPERSIILVRNPEWDRRTDRRPAYPDRIEWELGVQPNVAGRQIFNGESLVNAGTPERGTLKLFATRSKDRISFTPLGNRFVAVNTERGPFSDVNARRAFAAALNRVAMRTQRGGAHVGDIATHFLPPAVPGFQQAGGVAGPGADYLGKPAGDPVLAARYMRKAGFPSGKAGGRAVTVLGPSDPPARDTTQVVRDALASLGFHVNQRLYDQQTLLTRYCGVPEEMQRIDVCHNVGWIPDFNDPYAMLHPNFNGNAIQPTSTTNVSLFRDPAIDAAMRRAALIRDEAQRARAWGRIDRQLVEQVPAIPFLWEIVANVASKNVHGVVARWNGSWDLSYTSLK